MSFRCMSIRITCGRNFSAVTPAANPPLATSTSYFASSSRIFSSTSTMSCSSSTIRMRVHPVINPLSGMPCCFMNRMSWLSGMRRSLEPGMRYPCSAPLSHHLLTVRGATFRLVANGQGAGAPGHQPVERHPVVLHDPDELVQRDAAVLGARDAVPVQRAAVEPLADRAGLAVADLRALAGRQHVLHLRRAHVH